MSTGQGRQGSFYRFDADQFAKAGGKAKYLIGAAGRIGKEVQTIPGCLPETPEMFGFARPDNCETAVLVGKLLRVSGQVSDLLTAEDSAEMSDKDKNRRLCLPKL